MPMVARVVPSIDLLSPLSWEDYSLLDSGNGLKLERFGAFTLIRPEVQAIWRPALGIDIWKKAHAQFVSTGEESGGHWNFRTQIPETWSVNYDDLTFLVRMGNSRHLGFFPEQASHWRWISEKIRSAKSEVKVLNLFGYTGVSTLAAAKAGAHVTHVDASRKSVNQARENQSLSGLSAAPIRWIVDDALKFVQREIRRGSKYQGIILDPPKFGRGPKGEVWEFFDLLPQLLENLRNLLADDPLFILLTAYAIRASALMLFYAMSEMMSGTEGKYSIGELILQESSANRQLSLAIYGRWLASAIMSR